jgi:PAS domain S-box-containing protein
MQIFLGEINYVIMAQNFSHEVETTVNALLQVGDRVVEVSKEHVITKIWDSYLSTMGNSYQYLGKSILQLGTESILKQCDDLITRSFALKDNNYIQYHVQDEKKPASYSIRILAIHPHEDYLFVVIKNLSSKEGIEIVEDKWKLALDAAGDGVWDLNMQTGKIVFSSKWHDIFGYDTTDISKWDDWSSRIHPDDKGGYLKNMEDYLAGKTPCYSVEQRYLCKDGTYKWILSRGVVIARTNDGKPLRAVGTHHDIHEKKIAEEALKTSRETFASAFDHSGIGIALISPDGKWLDVNNVICEMTGFTKEELLKLTHLDVTYPDDKGIDSGLIEQMLDKDIYTYTIEKRYLSKQKKIVYGLLTVSLVWNGDNTPKFFITQVIDITKKKELENELRKKNTELEAVRVSLTNKIHKFDKVADLKSMTEKIRELVEATQSKYKGDESLKLLGEYSNSLNDALANLLAGTNTKG